MALATYKDLAIDAVDPAGLGAFWAAVLGLGRETLPDGDALLTGPTRQHAVWVNQVPEPVTVKQRVHLDVHAGSVDDVLALGATPHDLDSFRWKVLRDPEGGELCVFEREEVPAYRLYELAVDCHDPVRLATWWADVLGAKAQHGEEWSWVEQVPGMPFEAIVFAPVPEPKTVKNRIHWDLTCSDVDLLTGDGAHVLREPDDDIRWTVLADPEGNEFCVFAEEG